MLCMEYCLFGFVAEMMNDAICLSHKFCVLCHFVLFIYVTYS